LEESVVISISVVTIIVIINAIGSREEVAIVLICVVIEIVV
jgi:hypothetical protein